MKNEIPGLRFLDCEIQMPLMSLPVRSVIVPLAHGNILFSPGSELTDEQYATLTNITDIVAPNLLHCAGIPKAAEKFPRARVWGAKGAKQHKPEMPWTHELTEDWPYAPELPAIELGGMPRVREFVFLHPASATLIATDLCFHLTHPSGWGAWILLHLFSTYKKFSVSRLFTKFIQDREAFEKSLGKLFTHSFENIVMSHGDAVKGGGKPLLRAALAERKLEPR